MKKFLLVFLMLFCSAQTAFCEDEQGILLTPNNVSVSSYRNELVVRQGEREIRVVLCRSHTNINSDVRDIARAGQRVLAEAQERYESGENVKFKFSPFNSINSMACGNSRKYEAIATLFEVISL